MSLSTIPATDKQYVLDKVNQFPDSASLEMISEELALLAALRRSEAEYEAGMFISNEEAKRRSSECLMK